MSVDAISEARRQLEICNACRYCEGFCSVFPAVHRRREFSDAALTHMANLCHDCRGCYYACQYVEPHEFALNLPAVLAGVRQQSWQTHAWPPGFARVFQHSGVAITLATVAGLCLLILVIHALGSWHGEGFYGVLSHSAMIAIFTPAFALPLLAIAVAVRRYWRATSMPGEGAPALTQALSSVATMKNLSGGHGDGCNFEDEDRFSNARRWLHQATMYGFLLCFASTCTATVMHYFLDLPAPYPITAPPKLLGISGGLLLCAGTLGLAWLKLRADQDLGTKSAWGGEMGFVLLLFLVSASGLMLYWLGSTALMPGMLVFHLGTVLAFFLLMPYTKMLHGFFRLAALMRDSSEKARGG